MSEKQKCDNCGTMLPNATYTELANGFMICATCVTKLHTAKEEAEQDCEVIPRESSQIKSVLGAGRMLLSSVRDGIPVVLSSTRSAARPVEVAEKKVSEVITKKSKVDRGPALMPMPSANVAVGTDVSSYLSPSQAVLRRNEALQARRRMQEQDSVTATDEDSPPAMSLSDRDRMLKLLLRERKALKLRVEKLESQAVSLEKIIVEKQQEVNQAQAHLVQLRSRVSGAEEGFQVETPEIQIDQELADVSTQNGSESLEELEFVENFVNELPVADVSFNERELDNEAADSSFDQHELVPEQQVADEMSEELAETNDNVAESGAEFVSRDISCIWNRYEPNFKKNTSLQMAESEHEKQAMEDAALYAGVDWAKLSLTRDAKGSASAAELSEKNPLFCEREPACSIDKEDANAPKHSMPFVNGGRE